MEMHAWVWSGNRIARRLIDPNMIILKSLSYHVPCVLWGVRLLEVSMTLETVRGWKAVEETGHEARLSS